MYSMKSLFICCTVALICITSFETSNALPSFGHYVKRYDPMGSIDFIQMCLNSCMQCKKMFGEIFESDLCAESCLKFKGKAVPNCEDVGSITHFLNALE